MNIGSIGFNHVHDKYFMMDRPDGPGCWLFLLIKTTAFVEIDGEEFKAKANSCVLFSPQTAIKYRALDDSYIDDWFYFWKGDMKEEEYFANLNIPINKVLHLGNIDELSHIMHIMTYEHYSVDEHHLEIEKHYTEILFRKISRILNSTSAVSTKSFIEKNSALTNIRTVIHTMPDTIGNIDDMAKQAGMSRSGFQHLYKKMFGVSVMNDVIRGRLSRAKRLLSSTSMTIEEISSRCGYSNVYGFMRQFKKYVGKTPTEFRKNL